MEDTKKIDIQVSAGAEQEKKEVQKSFPFFSRKNIVFIGIGLGILILIMGTLYLFLPSRTVQNVSVTPSPTQIVVPSAVPTSMPQQIDVYTISGNAFQNIATINSKAQLPAVDPAGFLYSTDQNKVLQFSVSAQTTKEIYTNTKDGTKIANITFLAPSYVYVSIVSDPASVNYDKQLDHGSYLLEINISTNAVRTIGPLETVTNGYITYLFKSQDNDVLNIIGKSYCRESGNIFAIGSGSAKFVTKNGSGCNGTDPYFIGQIENGLVLAQPASSSQPDNFASRYEKLYALDVFSGHILWSFDMNLLYPENKNMLVGETKCGLSNEKTVVYCVTGAKVFSIDIATRKIVKTFDLAALPINVSNYTIIAIVKNTLYLLSDTTKSFALLDLKTNTLTNFSQNIITDPAHTRTLIYLGQLNNQPVFSTSFVGSQ